MTSSEAVVGRDRNVRGHGDRLRRELLDAATVLMAAPRPAAAPSLRAVARATGVAPSAVYLHFDSGRQLAEAVVEDVFADLRRTFDAADDPEAVPVQRVRLVARALCEWAERRPGAYQLLFEAPDLAWSGHEADPHSYGPGRDLLDRVHRLLVLAGRDPDDAGRLVLRLWAGLHGLVSLRLHKPQAPWETDLLDDVDAVLAALLAAPAPEESAAVTGG